MCIEVQSSIVPALVKVVDFNARSQMLRKLVYAYEKFIITISFCSVGNST